MDGVTEIFAAQPADAIGSNRWDYAVRLAGTDALSRLVTTAFVAAASATKHPHLVPVLDASVDSYRPYLVMPRLTGQTLAEHFERDARLPLAVGLWTVRQVAEALQTLHQAGWIHGDVKPENILVSPTGHTTLIDLGFARKIHTVRRGIFQGTPAYAAPEAMDGSHAAIEAMDTFSLGRVLWQCLNYVAESPWDNVSRATETAASLVSSMIHPNANERPKLSFVVKQLFDLELKTLGTHIQPGRRAA